MGGETEDRLFLNLLLRAGKISEKQKEEVLREQSKKSGCHLFHGVGGACVPSKTIVWALEKQYPREKVDSLESKSGEIFQFGLAHFKNEWEELEILILEKNDKSRQIKVASSLPLRTEGNKGGRYFNICQKIWQCADSYTQVSYDIMHIMVPQAVIRLFLERIKKNKGLWKGAILRKQPN